MKSIAELVSIALLSGLLASCASEQRTTVNSDRIVTNPIDFKFCDKKTKSKQVKTK